MVSLGERLRPNGERLLPQHGTLGEKIPPQGEKIPPQHGIIDERYQALDERYQGEHGTLDERYQALDERYQGEHGILGERYQALDERYQGQDREKLLEQMPDDIKLRIEKVGKRVLKTELNQLVIDMCAVCPLGMDELALLLHRNAKSFKNKNIKLLLETKRLFYWIPEMINHPQQKYIADLSMTRSNTKKKNK